MSGLNGKVHIEPAAHFELRAIVAENVDGYWIGRVKEDVANIISRAEGYLLLPEEVYVSLRRRRAHLWLLMVDGLVKGWVILQAQRDEWSGEGFLLIWLGQADTTEAKDLFFEEIERFARARQFKAVRLNGRAGWARKPPNKKWRVAEVICELRIEEGNE